MQSWAPLAAPADFGTERCDPHQNVCVAQRAQGFLRSVTSGREEKFARRSCCAGEGKCPFLCVPVAQREFPCCRQTREKVLLQATTAAPGIVPCCVLSPQASSAGSEGGRNLLRAKPAGRVISLPPLPPLPCSPGTASLQSLGGKGEGGGYCPNALSHVITPVQCPTQLLITTRVKLSSTVSE